MRNISKRLAFALIAAFLATFAPGAKIQGGLSEDARWAHHFGTGLGKS
jgi:hypothetical protein